MQSDHMRSIWAKMEYFCMFKGATLGGSHIVLCNATCDTSESPPNFAVKRALTKDGGTFANSRLTKFPIVFVAFFTSFTQPHTKQPYDSAALRSTWKSSRWIQTTAWWRNSRRATSTSSGDCNSCVTFWRLWLLRLFHVMVYDGLWTPHFWVFWTHSEITRPHAVPVAGCFSIIYLAKHGKTGVWDSAIPCNYFIQIRSGSITSIVLWIFSALILPLLALFVTRAKRCKECVFVTQVGRSSQFNRGLCSLVETMFSEVPRRGFHLEIAKRWQDSGRKETMQRHQCVKASKGKPNQQIWW